VKYEHDEDKLGDYGGGTKFRIGGGITMNELSNNPFLKEKIMNSLQYRVKNKIATSVSMNCFPEFL
jgi:hypothetical protein